MTNNSIRTTKGKNTFLYRAYTGNGSLSSTQYLPTTKFKIGRNSNTINVADTDLTEPIPITDGTVNDDGSNQLTGSNGGDNSTDNTTTYKQGAGQSDNTSQNLIANGTNATKTWTISNLASAGTNMTGTQPASLWLYIKDATALAKFLTSGTAIEIKFGSDSSNYYSKTYEASDLSTGWNYLSTQTTNIEDLTETGTVSGNIDTFIIEITTNNATDTFVAGDVVYDLLRQWQSSNLIKDFTSGYPDINFVTNEVTIRCFIASTEANGFNIDSLGDFNQDTTPLLLGEDNFEDESKSDTDEFAFIIKDRII